MRRTVSLGKITLALALAMATACAPAWARKAEHVFIISYDGGKPAVMQECKMPRLRALLKKAAVTWNAQTIFPSITLPSHTSMLTGVGPDKHKVNWNEWEPHRGMTEVPTIFKLAKEHKLTTAMFVNKPKFIHLFQGKTLNNFSLPSFRCVDSAAAAADYIKLRKPNLCFIHFADSDSTGHTYGWGSKEQRAAFEEQDKALNVIVDSIKAAGIEDSSVVILSADHGGHDKTHGTTSPEDMTIPWIVWGRGVKPEHKIDSAVTTYDTAATALWLLDVPLPADFDGKPVTEAFDFAPAISQSP